MRRPVSVAVVQGALHVACDDGSVWGRLQDAQAASEWEDHAGRRHRAPGRPARWIALPPIPGSPEDALRRADEEDL